LLEGGFGKRASFHPPELCYVGSDFDILAREPILVSANGQARRVMRLVIAQRGQQVEAWYWFTVDDRTTHNYYQQQLWLITDAVLRRPTEGTLVRISTPLGDDPDASHRRLLAFLTSFESANAARQVARDGV
ncbi:MAG: EpsI family protein, partial [Candidatus Omnitrophica bacterium]|nr:EpsI family protein [Candidatus Omnitrophota bacterium]